MRRQVLNQWEFVPIGTVAIAYALSDIPALIESVVDTGGNCLLAIVAEIKPFLPSFSIQKAQAESVADPLPRLSFRDREPLEVIITAGYRIQHDLRETFLSAVSKLRGYLLSLTDAARPVCGRCAAWLNRQAERIPQSVGKEERVPASGFVLKGVSNANVTGRISSADGNRLSLTFTVADSYVPEANDYIDFDFILANSSIGLADTTIPGRVVIDLAPTFLDEVSDQTYEVDTAITPLVLPEATSGNPPLTYSLTGEETGLQVPGLRFDAETRTLSGTPTLAGRYTMIYTVTDDDGDTDALSFAIVVTAGSDVLIPETVVVPGGTFRMGALNDWSDDPSNTNYERCVEWERKRDDRPWWCYEFPRHTVTVRSFAVGVYEVTNAQWDACVADGVCGRILTGEGTHPVYGVSWPAVQAYLGWLSDRTGETVPVAE